MKIKKIVKVGKIKKVKVSKTVEQIRIPAGYSLEETGTTQSLIAKYLQCRIGYLLALNRWYDPAREKSMVFGTIVHEILDRIYTQAIKKKTISSSFLIEKWVKGFKIDELTKGKIYVVMTEYMSYYHDDFQTKNFTDAEHTFAVDFKGAKLRGKIDLRFLVKNKLWIMEHKTKGRIEEAALLLILNFDFQNLFYILASELEKKQDVQGVLYNVIRNPSSKPLKDESLKQYLDKLRLNIQKDPEHFFKRFEIPYTVPDKRRFGYELDCILREIYLLLNGKIVPYRNCTSCVSQYKCDYLSACGTGTLAGYKKKPHLFMELD